MTESPQDTRTPILIIGDAGPSRYALLQRTDISAYWATSLVGALATLRQNTPKACIIHPSDGGEGLENFIGACVRNDGPPCIVVLRAEDWNQQGRWISAGAAEVVQIELTQQIMELLGSYTGLRFAKEERATIELSADIHHDGTTQKLSTTDLSASGLGLKGLGAKLGDLVQSHLSLDGQIMSLWSRVVRTWTSPENAPMVGLRFIGLTSSQTEQIRDFVRQTNESKQGVEVTVTNLFEGITQAPPPKTLLPGEFSETEGRNDQWITEASTNLQVLESHAENPDETIAPFLVRLYSSLSDIEIRSLKTHGDPKWVYQIVHTLVCIESWKHNHPDTQIPKSLYDRANEQFRGLNEHEAEGESVAVQVSIIRAHLLKHLLSKREITRS